MRQSTTSFFSGELMRPVTTAIGTVFLLTSLAVAEIPAGISWYGMLDEGLAVAQRWQRPILLLSAAPQCAGIPGLW